MSLISPQLSEAERKRLGRKIAAVCRSKAFTALLAPCECAPLAHSSLIIAQALHQVLHAGDVCGVYGYALSPLGAPTIFRQAVLRLGSEIYADGVGISGRKGLHNRWLRAGVMITEITPLPPVAAWPRTFPEILADAATIAQMAALFQSITA